MTRRPERLKATKLYGTGNATEQSKTSGGKDERLMIPNSYSTNKKKINTKPVKDSVHDRNELGTLKTRTTLKPEGTQQPKHEVKEMANLPLSDSKMQRIGENGLPKGFNDRQEMQQRLNRRKSISSEEHGRSKIDQRGLVTENKGGSNVQSKGNVKPNIPYGFVTMKDMETRIRNKKTKSTKLTPQYQEEKTSDVPKVTSIDTERDPRIKTKTNPNAKHLFSKLENRIDETNEDKQLEIRLPKQKKQDATNMPKMTNSSKPNIIPNPTSSLIKNTEDEKANIESKETDKSKINSQTDANNQTRKKSISSAGKPSVTITPRMTSTALPKPPRINAKASDKSNDKTESVKILMMNAHGKNDKGGTPAERRRHAIQDVVLKYEPKIVLFQEFRWSGVTGKVWAKNPIPERYVYKGHYDAGIMYDSSCINVKDLPASDIQTILTGLQSNATNKLKRTFPMDFNPVARMSLTRVTTSNKPALDFICISWHGLSNENSGGRMKELKKIEYFEYWMEFLRHIREKYKLPIVAGGDYNVDMYSIEKYVESPFKLCIYEASMRRTVKGIVDYCIVTEDLDFTDISWVNLEHDTGVFHPNEILDHDPVIGSLAVSFLGASDIKLGMGKKKSWPSPIVKPK